MDEIVPHAGTMVLLSRVLSHQEDRTVCAVKIDEQTLFQDRAGNVDSWIGLEYMAQCIAAHAGLLGRAAGTPPRVGLLLGSRRLGFHTSRFFRGQTLEVTARHVWGESPGMVAFDCAIGDSASGALLAEGRLNCFLPENGDVFGSET